MESLDDVNGTARRLQGESAQVAGAPEYRVRARFYAIRQVDGESAYDWYRRVRAAAVPCRFGVDRTAPVADKFVTGLRPGTVADRLLGEPADGPLEDLLAIAVAVEELARRRGAGADACSARGGPVDASSARARVDASSARARVDASSAGRLSTDAAGTGGTSRDALIDELREGLKLYRYSSEGYARQRAGSIDGGGGGGDEDDSYNGYLKSLHEPSKTVFIGNTKSTLDEKSWWKKKIERKSKQLENNITSKRSEKCVDENDENIYHDNSKCYCSSSWITNDGCQEQNLALCKSNKSKSPISKCLDYTKKIECCVCNA